MITSHRNSHLKDIRRLLRCKGDRALLEGPHLVADAAAAGLALASVLATPEFLAGAACRKLLALLPRPPLATAPELLEEIADSDSPRGVIAVAELPRRGAGELPVVEGGVYLYAEGLQDPGNLGALARVAEASGAAGMCLSRGSVHPNHPRALRASAGSLLRLPVAVRSTDRELDERLAPLSPTWAALDPRGGKDLFRCCFDDSLVLALGAEGGGLSPEVRHRAELRITVPVAPSVESLNVAVAAAVVLFEIRRQNTGLKARAIKGKPPEGD